MTHFQRFDSVGAAIGHGNTLPVGSVYVDCKQEIPDGLLKVIFDAATALDDYRLSPKDESESAYVVNGQRVADYRQIGEAGRMGALLRKVAGDVLRKEFSYTAGEDRYAEMTLRFGTDRGYDYYIHVDKSGGQTLQRMRQGQCGAMLAYNAVGESF